MNTQANKTEKHPGSLVSRITRTYTSAMLLINAVMIAAFCYINLNYLYTNTLVDMANRVATQFEDSMRSQDVESAFRESRTFIFLRQLNELNKYSRPEKVRLYVVFPNGVASQCDPDQTNMEFKLLPPQLFGVFNKTIVSDQTCTEYPNPKNGFRYWITSVPIHSKTGFTGGMVITSIYTKDVMLQLIPTFTMGTVCIILSLILLFMAQKSFYVFLHSPLENITNALENWSLGHYERSRAPERMDEIGRLSRKLEEVAERLEVDKEKRDQDEENRRNFFFNVSHELKTPVASLRAQAELLKDGLASPEEVSAYYDGILQEATHLQSMVDDLLTLSRLQAPGYTMEMEVCCIYEILNDVYLGMSRVASERDIRIDVEQSLAPEHTLVMGNYTRIRQMILIFLENAVKYSGDHSEVGMQLAEEDDGMVLYIRDHGCGIPQSEQEDIFQFQYRASNAGNREGTGLGLPIAREIASQMNFRIGLESTLNEGTTVRIVMPRVEE